MDEASGYELSVTRLIDAPPATVWRVWTERFEEWWAPKPWTTRIVEQDLRPGGRSALVMHGPDGAGGENVMEGVFLEVVPGRRVVFTDAFRTGWIPQKAFIVGWFELADEGGKTRYTAGARHWDEAAMKQHEAMGFVAGWGIVADQLAALAEAAARGTG